MNKKSAFIFLFISAAVLVYSQQDDVSRLINLLDDTLNNAKEIGRLAPASGQPNSETPTIFILNKTGYTVKSVFISPNTDNWGVNIINRNLYKGESARIILNTPLAEISRYNFRMVDEGGDRYSKHDVEIADYATIEISIGDLDFED